MNTNSPDGRKDCDSIVNQLIERLDALEAENQRLRERVDDLEGRLDSQNERVDDLEGRLDSQNDRVGDLEKRLEDQDVRSDALSKKIDCTKDDVTDRIEDIEGRVRAIEDADPRGLGGENGVRDGEDDDDREDGPTTPLEVLTNLPEHVAQKELTANQERARFIAKDVEEYARKVPRGLRIDSATIKKVLKAKEGQTPHNQTVSRTMDFLARFGKSNASLKKRHGKRFVVFDPTVTDRYGRSSDGDREDADTDRAMNTTVVTALG